MRRNRPQSRRQAGEVEMRGDERPAARRHHRRQPIIGEQRDEPCRERRDIFFGKAIAGFAFDDAFLGAAEGRGDDRQTGGLSLEQNHREAFRIAVLGLDAGRANTRARSNSAFTRIGGKAPRNLASTPSVHASCSSPARKGPSPTIVSAASGSCAFTRSIARKRYSQPFFSTRRPTKSKCGRAP